MLSRLPGPRSLLTLWLLRAIADGCESIRIRRTQSEYDAVWTAGGVEFSGVAPPVGYIRRLVGVLGLLAGRRWSLPSFVRRWFTTTEQGTFDLPVGTDFLVGVSYRAEWHRGRVTTLVILLGDNAVLGSSGIADSECRSAWYEPLGD